MRFELVPGEGAAPFMVLSDAGHLARVLLARVAAGNATLVPVALKVRRDRPRRALSGAPLTQREVAGAWLRAVDGQHRLIGVAGVAQPLPLAEDPLLGEGKGIVWCSERWLAFPLVCPACGHPLRECVDEGMLEAVALPTPGESDITFLTCDACPQASPPVFYSAVAPDEVARHAADLRDFSQWVVDLGTHRTRHDAEVVPCVACDQAALCFPASGGGRGAERLIPLAMHGAYTQPLELLHLHFDEHMALLGGQGWDDLLAEHLAGAATAARRRGLAEVGEAYREGQQYLFAGDHAGAFQLEVLHLKLAAFRALLDGVAEIHETLCAPHLRLEPSNVMARLAGRVGTAAARWATSVAVLGPGGAQPLLLPAADGPTGLFRPPREVRQAYAAPPVATGTAGRGERATVRLDTVADGEFAARVTGGPLEAVANDGLLLQISAPSLGVEEVALWGRVVEARRGEMRVVGNLSLPSETVLAKAEGEVVPDAVCIHYPTLHVPCDLFSLGRLWLHALLVNDRQSAAVVAEACDAVADRARGASDGDLVRETLCEAMAAHGDLFAPLACLYQEADRQSHQAGCPDLLWEELLLFGFQLMLWRPDFGFCAHRGDYEAEFPRGPIDRAIAVLHALATRVRAHLFGTDPFHRDVQEALERFAGIGTETD